MLDIDYARFKLYARVWGIGYLLIGAVEFGLFLLGSITTGESIAAPLTIPYLAAGLFAWYFPRSGAFLYYAVISAMGGLYGLLISGRVNVLILFYLLMAGFLLFIYTQMAALEREEGLPPDDLMQDLFPKIAIGAGVLALLLSPLSAFADSLPALSTPGLQLGTFGLGMGIVALLSVEEQKVLSIGGVVLGVISALLWLVLAVL